MGLQQAGDYACRGDWLDVGDLGVPGLGESGLDLAAEPGREPGGLSAGWSYGTGTHEGVRKSEWYSEYVPWLVVDFKEMQSWDPGRHVGENTGAVSLYLSCLVLVTHSLPSSLSLELLSRVRIMTKLTLENLGVASRMCSLKSGRQYDGVLR